MSVSDLNEDESDLKTVSRNSKDGQEVAKECIKRAKADPKFMEKLKADVKATLREVAKEKDLDLRIHQTKITILEESETEGYLVLPFDGELNCGAGGKRPAG